jgi:hypothetical protein
MRMWRVLSGLLVTPVAALAAILLLPEARGLAAVADLVAFAGAAAVALTGLATAATAEVRLAVALGVGLVASLTLGVVAWRPPSPEVALVLVDTALVCLAWGFGTSLGRRVQHASHLFPASVVAASADVLSLSSPEGPSHAVVSSERALALLALWFPVPGTRALSPALGVGDLLFIAFVFGVARAQRLPYVRAVVACALGVAIAGGVAAWLRVAIPALVPIAALVILSLPDIRRLREVDRRAAHVSMLLAVALAVLSLLRSLKLR